MATSCISPVNIVLIFRTKYDPTDQSFTNFSDVARQKTLWLVFIVPKYSTPSYILSKAVVTPMIQISANYVSFDVIFPHAFLLTISLLMHATVSLIFC